MKGLKFQTLESPDNEICQQIFSNVICFKEKVMQKLSFLLKSARIYMQINNSGKKIIQKTRIEITSQNTIRDIHKGIIPVLISDLSSVFTVIIFEHVLQL